MKNTGFTLVELSIVLVIIGLLIGGILVGQSLIESAKINAQIQQLQQFDIAIPNFKAKFKQIPGDCSNCGTVAGLNGDANGILNDASNSTPPSYFYKEINAFFPQLYSMGQLPGQYVSAGAGRYDIGKTNAFPFSKLGTGGIAVTGNTSKQLFYTFIQNSTGSNDYHFNTRMAQGNFTPAQALAIDAKIDDSIPSTGTVMAVTTTVVTNATGRPFNLDSAGNCVSSTTVYNTTSTAEMPCRLIVKSDYR